MDLTRRQWIAGSLALTLGTAARPSPSLLNALHAFCTSQRLGTPRYVQITLPGADAATLREMAISFSVIFTTSVFRLTLQGDGSGPLIATLHLENGSTAVFVSPLGNAPAISGVARFTDAVAHHHATGWQLS